LSSCVLLAVPSAALAKTEPATKAPSPWAAVLKSLTKSENVAFSADYTLVMTKNGKTTSSQTVTYAQDPSKKEVALITPDGSFYVQGSNTVACGKHEGHFLCTSIPASPPGAPAGLNPMAGLEGVFAPGIIASSLNAQVQAIAASKGATLSDVSGTYGTKPGYASTCLKLTKPGMALPALYCASNQYGALTYAQSESKPPADTVSTVTIEVYTANPKASTFTPPVAPISLP
jgi:hypothetical protein